MAAIRRTFTFSTTKLKPTTRICQACSRKTSTSPLVFGNITSQANQLRSFSISRAMSAKYPTREEVEDIFKNMETGNFPEMMKHIDPNVDWTVMGTHPCAGRYQSLEQFNKHTLQRLGAIMKEPGIKLLVRNVIGGGDQAWAVVELIAEAECKNGLNFDNTYAWCVRFNEDRKVVQVRAYLDSTLVKQAVEENECPSHRAPTHGD